MRAWLFLAIVGTGMLGATSGLAAQCEFVNGSFEDDGVIADLSMSDPNGWMATVPTDKFIAYIRNDWVSDGSLNVSMASKFNKTFAVGDTVAVSQDIDLSAAEAIIFDVKLAVGSHPVWDNADAVAAIMIDGEVVWDSNELGTDPQGEYYGLQYVVEPQYRTGLHTVSLGIRMNADVRLFKQHIAHWDNVSMTCYCGGGGLLAGDFNGDCVVDGNDLASLASVYMLEPPVNDVHNLYKADDFAGEGGMVNFYDLAAMVADWDGAMEPVAEIALNWLEDVAIDSPANRYVGNDVPPTANVNFFDYVLMLDNWLGSSLVEEEPQDPVQ